MVDPRSIALIGASSREGSVGHAVIENLLKGGYKGKLYPVNPSSSTVLGLKCYANVNDIPEPIDLAVIAVPGRVVAKVIEDCGKKRISGAVIISAGFKEAGASGRELEEQVVMTARKFGVRLIGPNCVGLINSDPKISMNASFAKQMPRFGNISLVSQSGAICGAMLEYAKIKEIGFSKVFSLGNKADLNENDVLDFLSGDPTTKVILMYVEDLVDASRFINIASKVTRNGSSSKPILAMKAGESSVGTKAIASHTGALAGWTEAYDAIFKKAGILKVETLEQLFDYAMAFSYQPIPRVGGCAVISNAGGPAAITADAAARCSLRLASLSAKTTSMLTKILPKNAMMINPIDIIGDADHLRYERVLRTVLEDDGVSSCIVISTPQLMLDVGALARVIVNVNREFAEKTLFTCITSFMEGEDAMRILDDNHVPQYSFPESATYAMSLMQQYGLLARRSVSTIERYDGNLAAVNNIIAGARGKGRKVISGPDAMKILGLYGLRVVGPVLARNEEECALVAKKTGYPVVLKISSPDIVHKVDAGGVELDIKNDDEVRHAFHRILDSVKKTRRDATIDGITVEPFVKNGKEVIIGAKRDPQFGPLVMFGTGGIYVNVFHDVAFRMAPISEVEAVEMVDSTKAGKILDGVRGEAPSDREAVMDALKRTSQLVAEVPEILELDVNPLIVFQKGMGCIAVDARIFIS